MYRARKKEDMNEQQTVESANKLLSVSHGGSLLRSATKERYFDELPQQDITQINMKAKESSNCPLPDF